ncbi:fumarylacetoacetate hydrolase family protein [Candidatus Sumerlaeota bacterium]|nr:fumarylacetoacetate hydrolase family protein [Candidatus Sumerlaeota bacterium]
MKLFTFRYKGLDKERHYPGLYDGARHYRVRLFMDSPDPLKELFLSYNNDLEKIREAIGNAEKEVVAEEDIIFLAPILTPQKVICIGLNYRDHVLEQNRPVPRSPVIFSKFPSALTGHKNDVPLPLTSTQVDYEGELAFYIGKQGKRIPKDEAYSYIAGYTVFNDVTARDFQFSDKQWQRGKSCDAFAPTGPYIVTRDEIPDPHTLSIRTFLNDKIMQDSNTRNLIFDIPTLVEFISQEITLLPGDIIATGTPSGVGVFRTPQVFIKSGDVVRVEIEKIGVLENRFV